MAVQVLIDGVDRTAIIRFGSLSIRDQINNGSDTCDFIIVNHEGQSFIPQINSEIVVNLGGDKIYGGVLVQIEQSVEAETVVVYAVKCRDYVQYLDRKLITERYENTNLQAVILDLLDRYADDYGFTGNNVFGSEVSIRSVSFNELTFSQALQKLAKLTGFSWYVDYEKDIHFFKKNQELAPFNLSDTSNNYILESLIINEDISQLRNKVKVRGGEAVAEERTELYAGNGEQATFPLGSKFSEVPSVFVDGVEQVVGVDHLNQNVDDYDVMWSFGQKYLKFNTGHIPAAPSGGDTTNIEVTGTPLKPIVVQKQHNPSIAEFGLYEFVIHNDSLNTRDEALQFAQTELESYADSIREGSFETYEPGLRSGQVIDIASVQRGINEKLIIQSVEFQMISINKFVWSVTFATLKTIGILDILQKLLLEERIAEGEDETLLNFFQLSDNFLMTDSIAAPVATTTEDYVWEQGDPGSDSYPNPIIWNKFTWE